MRIRNSWQRRQRETPSINTVCFFTSANLRVQSHKEKKGSSVTIRIVTNAVTQLMEQDTAEFVI